MLFDTHKNLYKALQDNDHRVDKTLQEAAYDVLPDLLHTQEKLMDRLRAIGPCRDVDLLPLLMETRAQLADTALVLQHHRNQLAGRLKATGTKRKLAQAYRRGMWG